MEVMNPTPTQEPNRTSVPFPTPFDVLALLGIFFVSQIGVMLFASLVLLATGQGLADLMPEARGGYLALTTLLSLAIAAGAFLWYRHVRGGKWLSMGLAWRRFRPMLLLWAFVMMSTAGVLLEPLYELMPMLHQDVGRGLWSIVAVVVIAPVFEEFICRGFLFGSLRERYGTTRAVLFSSLFFGILHLQPVAVINAFVMGVVLAVVYAMTRTLWAPILLHAANNALAYLLIVAGCSEMRFSELFGGERWLYLLFYGATLCLFAWSVWSLWQMVPRKAPVRASSDKNEGSM